jgi:hypothetical protein
MYGDGTIKAISKLEKQDIRLMQFSLYWRRFIFNWISLCDSCRDLGIIKYAQLT